MVATDPDFGWLIADRFAGTVNAEMRDGELAAHGLADRSLLSGPPNWLGPSSENSLLVVVVRVGER